MMKDFSVLIGGQAGDGINQAGLVIARLLNQLGYRISVYFDYPSLIRGGHNFSIIRASQEMITAHRDKIDCLLALNQDSIELHRRRLNDKSFILYNSDKVKSDGLAIPLDKIVKEEKAPVIMRNSCLIGAFAKALDIKWEVLEQVFKKHIPKAIELNLKIARRGFDTAKLQTPIKPLATKPLPLLTGNEAVGLGLIKGGLKAYIAYPMTPASSILHYLAGLADEFGLKVIHPENEISVILMGLGFAYTGQPVAVGTSGGGFCLMTEGVSLSGMAEVPITVIVSQRPGPSTGMPTYTAQGDLGFVLNAGQGEFARLVVAPGDVQEAYAWSNFALKTSWKYQIPVFILMDKTLSEGTFNIDPAVGERLKTPEVIIWDRKQPYKRYLYTETGISPLAFVADKDAVIKVNSYEHDQTGIAIEESKETVRMQDKRLRKEKYLSRELGDYETVKIYGDPKSPTALLCWGSNKGVCQEVARSLGIRMIQPLVLFPFPMEKFKASLKGIRCLISVENNTTGQLARHINRYGFKVDKQILKYDGRPFTVDELEEKIKNIL